MSGQADLTHEDVKRILQIVDEAGDMEVVVEYGGLKLRVQKGTAGQANTQAPLPAPSAPSQEAPQPAPAAAAPAPAAEPAAPASAPAPEAPAQEPASDAGDDALPDGTVAIRAPMLGRFFQASSPTEPPFVEVGSKVGPDDTVCLIEVMKLFNNVKAGVAGTVVEIRASNEAMVEDEQVLFVVQPD